MVRKATADVGQMMVLNLALQDPLEFLPVEEHTLNRTINPSQMEEVVFYLKHDLKRKPKVTFKKATRLFSSIGLYDLIIS